MIGAKSANVIHPILAISCTRKPISIRRLSSRTVQANDNAHQNYGHYEGIKRIHEAKYTSFAIKPIPGLGTNFYAKHPKRIYS